MYVCWSNGQRSMSRGSFWSFTWLHAYLRDSLYKWHKYNPRCGNESRKISGSNGQTARSRGSFEIFLVSAAWLRVCLNDSFNMRHKYIYNYMTMYSAPFQVKMIKCHTGRWKFLWCPLLGSVSSCPIRLMCGTNTTQDSPMCCAPFPGQGQRWRSHGSFLW